MTQRSVRVRVFGSYSAPGCPARRASFPALLPRGRIWGMTPQHEQHAAPLWGYSVAISAIVGFILGWVIGRPFANEWFVAIASAVMNPFIVRAVLNRRAPDPDAKSESN